MKAYRVVLGVVLAVGLIGAAVVLAWMAYSAGLAQGSPQAAVAPAAVPPYAAYGPFFMAPFGFGFLGCLVPLVFLFLVFGLFRLVAWGGMHRHMPEGWGPRGPFMPEKMRERWHKHLDEWHREAHAAGESEPSTKSPSA